MGQSLYFGRPYFVVLLSAPPAPPFFLPGSHICQRMAMAARLWFCLGLAEGPYRRYNNRAYML